MIGLPLTYQEQHERACLYITSQFTDIRQDAAEWIADEHSEHPNAPIIEAWLHAANAVRALHNAYDQTGFTPRPLTNYKKLADYWTHTAADLAEEILNGDEEDAVAS